MTKAKKTSQIDKGKNEVRRHIRHTFQYRGLNRDIKKIDSIGVDLILSLGDIVGYNSNPNECVELVRERNILSIAGNHDIRAAGQKEPDDFNEAAKSPLMDERKPKPENTAFLKQLPESLSIAVPPFFKGGQGD